MRRLIAVIIVAALLLAGAAGCAADVDREFECAYTTSDPNSLYYTNPIVTERADPCRWILLPDGFRARI